MDTPSYRLGTSSRQSFKISRNVREQLSSLGLAILLTGFTVSAAPRNPKFVSGEILIRPKANLSETNFTAKLTARGATRHRMVHRLNVHIVSIPEENADATLAALRNDPEIEFAERDYIAETTFVPNDPYLLSGNEWHLSRIGANQSWDFTAGLSNVLIAVLDSGINASHPDLAGKIVAGYDFVNSDSDPSDDFGHGTAVAGTAVAAGNNNIGVAGVAFGCRVLSVKVMDASGFGTYSCIAQGIRYAVDHGARVINLSLAGSSSSITLQEAIDYAWSNDVVIVAAAGNNADNVPQYPAACAHVIAVSATDSTDALASFSSYGPDITLAAPGDNIWTTQRDPNSPYGSWRGTSFASPIVAGVVALIASENPSLPNNQIVSILQQTADDLGAPGYDILFGFGRVNAQRALAAASAEPGALPPSPPTTGLTNGIPPNISTDTTAPSILITEAPKEGAHLTAPQIHLSGSANDNVGVQKVQVKLNGTTFPTDGTTNWNTDITLVPGANTITVHSIDLAGNVSPEIVRTATYVVMTPLVIQTTGLGAVSPDQNGELLEIGKAYKIKAVPDAGQAFAGWTGIESESPTLNFVMQSNLVLVANFVPSPFPAIKGRYAGLIANTNGVMPDNSGHFTLTVSVGGQFTGKVIFGGKSRSFRGQLNLAGDALATVKGDPRNPLALALHIDLTAGSDQIAGLLTSSAWVSELAGDRNVFNAKFNPAPQAGSRAFILQQADQGNITAANGSSTITRSGITRVKGKLADGQAFTAGSFLAKNGDYPLHVSLNRGQEIVIGWLNFPASITPAASGTVLWVRTGTNAFATTLQAASAP